VVLWFHGHISQSVQELAVSLVVDGPLWLEGVPVPCQARVVVIGTTHIFILRILVKYMLKQNKEIYIYIYI
jgi:hypothetical protein